MFDFNILVLTSVTLLLIAIIVLFRSVLLRSKEVDRMKQVLHGTLKKVASAAHVCPHHLGYLNSFPKGKPIPDECMGCSDTFECLAHKEKRRKRKKV